MVRQPSPAQSGGEDEARSMQLNEKDKKVMIEMRAGQADAPPAVLFLLERFPSLNSLMKAARLAMLASNWRKKPWTALQDMGEPMSNVRLKSN